MEEKLLQIEYSMNLDEISDGFKLFQRKYQLRRTILFTIVYVIALILGIDFLIRDLNNFYGYVLVGLSLGLIFYAWYKPVLIRRKMISTISSLAEETYISEFYKDKIKITTRILPEDEQNPQENSETEENSDSEQNTDAQENAESDEKSDEKNGGSEKADLIDNSSAEDTDAESQKEEDVVTTLYFGSDYLDALENETMFLLFVNKRLIYIYPKRCLSDKEQDKLREILKEKAILN